MTFHTSRRNTAGTKCSTSATSIEPGQLAHPCSLHRINTVILLGDQLNCCVDDIPKIDYGQYQKSQMWTSPFRNSAG